MQSMDGTACPDASASHAAASTLPPLETPLASPAPLGETETSAQDVCETCGDTGVVEIDVANWRHGHDTREVSCPDCGTGDDDADDAGDDDYSDDEALSW